MQHVIVIDDAPRGQTVPRTDLTDVLCFVSAMGYGSDVARGACAINRAVWNDAKLWHYIVNEQSGPHDSEATEPEYKKSHIKTRLFLAIENGQCDLVHKWLITFKANPSLADTVMAENGSLVQYNVPLVKAIVEGHTDIAKTLLLRGADPSSREGWWGTALDQAALRGNLEIFLLLLREYKVELPGAPVADSSPQDTPTDVVAGSFCDCLSYAIRNGHFEVMTTIIEQYKVPINFTIPKEEGLFSYVEFAINSGCLAMLKKILGLGAVVNYWIYDDDLLECAPLFCAIESKRRDMVRLLFKHGADANMPGYFWSRMTPLIWAAQHDQVSIARLLLKRGANPNAALDYDELNEIYSILDHGKSALHVFAEKLNPLGVSLMLKVCADCDAVTFSGLSALLSCAKAVGTPDEGAKQTDKADKIAQCVLCLELLVAEGANVNLRRDLSDVRDIEWNGDDEGEFSEDQFSAVMYAVKADAPALIASLSSLGADVCLPAASGRSSLMLAAELGLPDCMSAVLSAAARQLKLCALATFVNLECHPSNGQEEESGHGGRSAIFFCLGSDSDANAGMIEMLLQAGADASRVNDKGLTPRDIAKCGPKLTSVFDTFKPREAI